MTPGLDVRVLRLPGSSGNASRELAEERELGALRGPGRSVKHERRIPGPEISLSPALCLFCRNNTCDSSLACSRGSLRARGTPPPQHHDTALSDKCVKTQAPDASSLQSPAPGRPCWTDVVTVLLRTRRRRSSSLCARTARAVTGADSSPFPSVADDFLSSLSVWTRFPETAFQCVCARACVCVSLRAPSSAFSGGSLVVGSSGAAGTCGDGVGNPCNRQGQIWRSKLRAI